MQASRFSFITREDTLLGVCTALGEDFGFNPMLLRIPFAALLLWNPAIVFGTYLAGFVLVLASRILFPNRQSAVAAPAQTTALVAQFAPQNDTGAIELAQAA